MCEGVEIKEWGGQAFQSQGKDKKFPPEEVEVTADPRRDAAPWST